MKEIRLYDPHGRKKKMNKSKSNQTDTDVRISRKEHETVIITFSICLKDKGLEDIILKRP